MNKKFSTLVGCLALGSAFSAAVAVNSANGHYEFRKADVVAAPTSTQVNKIDAQKWYQLKAYDPVTKTYGVLVHFRELESGKVFLRVVPAEHAPLVASLWHIDYGNTDGLSGGKYRFVNKETNAALMYDNTFAYNSKGESKDASLSSAMVDGCVTRWAWYQGDTQSTNFQKLAPYAYFNNEKDSVMIMKADMDGFVSAYKDTDDNVLANGGVIASQGALEIQPVLADAIVLDAYDFNSMIDYNKQSVFDDGKAFGRFKFYEPNGKLINPDEKAFEGSAMQKTMNYEAQYNRADMEDIFVKAVTDLKGVADVAGMDKLVADWVTTGDKMDGLLTDIDDLNSEIQNIETRIHNNEKKEAKWGALAAERQEAANVAFEKVKDVVSGVEKNILSWNDYNKGEGYEAVKKAYDDALAAYNEVVESKDALGNINYPAVVEAAKDVYTAAQNVVKSFTTTNPGYYQANWALNDSKSPTYVVALTNEESETLSAYYEAITGLAQAKKKISNLTVKLETAKGQLESLNAELEIAKAEYATAYNKLQTAETAWGKTSYLLSNYFMRLNYKDNKKNDQYLMVDTAYWQKSVNPEDGDLEIVNSKPEKDDNLLISARYFFKLTYHPSQDSLVVEPLNASDMSEAEAEAGVYFKDSYAGQNFVYGTDIDAKASQASNSWTSTNNKQIVARLKFLNTSKWCLTASPADINAPLNARIAFDNPYDYLVRTTLDPGLYFIQSANNNGKYVVANLNGDLMYDVANSDQDYNLMPSTMFVVEKYGCEGGDLIQVRNREYGKEWHTTFIGQLYAEIGEDGEPTGNVFTVNAENYRVAPSPELDTKTNMLYVKDTYKFISVTNEYALTNEHHGYKYLTPETLPYNNYAFRYNRYNAENEFMNVGAKDYLTVSTGDDSYYELDTVYYKTFDGVRYVVRVPRNEFGYGAGVIDANSGKELPQLVRQAYTLKVKDVNLIDNDTTYVGVNTVYGEKNYFVARGISDMLDNHLAAIASFYLKADQFDTEKDTCYALINTLNSAHVNHAWNGYQRANVLSNGVIGEEDLMNTQEDNIDAFALTTNDRPLYREIEGNAVSFFRTVGGADQKLFEDATNQTGAPASNVLKDFGYLGLAQEKMTTNGTDKWVVDPWVVSNTRMPQYMFALELDSIADGLWCQTNTHGYFADSTAANAADEDHFVFYNGYTEGRFLVNLADSVTAGSQAYHNPDLFTYNGRAVRMGFVEGVHMYISADEAKHINDFLGDKTVAAGEYFFTPINGTTLDDLKNKEGYIIPKELFNKKNVNMSNFATKAGHNDWTFSLRLMNDDPEKFFIESNLDGVSSIGSMTGAWVKIENGCPVLNYISGNHQTILASNLIADNVTDGQLFTLTASTDDPTANEDITVSSVTVMAGEGQVQIVGAAGKKVVVTNILGQTVATTVLTSDNAAIAAPAGVVVVAIEGEEAVKAIVK